MYINLFKIKYNVRVFYISYFYMTMNSIIKKIIFILYLCLYHVQKHCII